MDPDWAISEIDEFVRVTDQVAYDNRPGSGVVHFGTHMRGSGTGTEAAQRAHVVEQILDRVLSGWERDRPKKDETYRWLRGQASRAKAALQRQEELAEKLGDNAPDMDAANLHSWAWENGKSYWNTGHYNQAVMQAAIRINAETQSKLGRMDVSETALFNEAFSLDPPNPGPLACGSPWMTVGRRTRTYNVALVPSRTVSTRRSETPVCITPEPSDGGEEQLALEQLAAFSLLARWVDQATVEAVRVSPAARM